MLPLLYFHITIIKSLLSTWHVTAPTPVSSWHTYFHPHPVLQRANTRTNRCHTPIHARLSHREMLCAGCLVCIQVQLLVSLLLCALCHKNQPVQSNNNKPLHFAFMFFFCMSRSPSMHPFPLLLCHQASFIWKSVWWLNHRVSKPDQPLAGCQSTRCVFCMNSRLRFRSPG